MIGLMMRITIERAMQAKHKSDWENECNLQHGKIGPSNIQLARKPVELQLGIQSYIGIMEKEMQTAGVI